MAGRLTSDRINIRTNEDLLLECVHARPDQIAIGELLQRPDFDWDSFWAYAGEQQVQPLVARVLSDPALAKVLPEGAQQAAKVARVHMTLNNLALRVELQAIGDLLHQHDIPVVPLKGTRLAERLFGSLDARRCGDIDILVPEQDWATANQLLIASGYTPAEVVRPGVEQHTFHGVPLVRVANGRLMQLEVHRQLTDPRFLTIDYQALWTAIGRSGDRPDAFSDLPAEETLVFLAVHAPKHSNGVLRLLADIDHLIAREGDQIDWNRVVELARAWHADTMLYFVLTLSTSLLATQIPDDTLRSIRPPYWKRVLVPLLAGPHTIVRPPMPVHLRANRSRIAYCLMLRRGRTILRSYWHYIMMPPTTMPDHPLAGATKAVSRPVEGLIWTVLAFGSAMRDRVRTASTAYSS